MEEVDVTISAASVMDEVDGGIASRVRSRKRKASLYARISRMQHDIDDRVVALSNTLRDIEEGKIAPPKAPEELKHKLHLDTPEALGDGTILPPNMPADLKHMIYAMNGTRLLLVVHKRLTYTDVSDHQNRLQITFNQMSHESHTFLSDEEKDFLNYRDEKGQWNHIDTLLLDMELNSWKIPLRKWVMNKDSGDFTDVYVLNSPWIKIVRKNNLKAGDDIQVWSFRVDDQLNLALVKMED